MYYMLKKTAVPIVTLLYYEDGLLLFFQKAEQLVAVSLHFFSDPYLVLCPPFKLTPHSPPTKLKVPPPCLCLHYLLLKLTEYYMNNERE